MTAPAQATLDDATLWRERFMHRLDVGGLVLTVVTVVCAVIWAFPLYWAVVTSLKPEDETIRPFIELWPEHPTLAAYVYVLTNSRIGTWYVNSVVTATAIAGLVTVMGAACGYAISQLRFPGRMVLWWIILSSFMVPIQALIVNHFVLMAQFALLNTWLGIILPQLIAPVAVIVYKQFFDSVPKELREAAVIDGAKHWEIFLRIYLPLNWGVTAALGIIVFIGAWNAFLWPFLVITKPELMNVTVGATEIRSQGINELETALLTGLPMAIVYLLFQRRVTEAVMLSAGIKG